ncbi:MAG: DUF433 domain-containing protein [Phycisphaeraceae bacterium]
MSSATLNVSDVISVDPERLGGVPVFKGSRVPISALFDYLRAGDSIERFLEHFLGITREQVDAVLQLAIASFTRVRTVE